ncbi:hypothetical protein HPB50_021004 [Hyalomma asiaticum]|uniref:Uncharacterized protein n=1 Tax=Hyalomma asiaticum TaxID=266040 RepID=A0ACB7T438_HYAAI|nr:hypothetical protein HPB50_021004 [Hyalomma asiaticum]
MRGPSLLLQSAIAAAFAAALVLPPCLGHVALTFPPARRYDLDFLDNGRTKGPCGMPKKPISAKAPTRAICCAYLRVDNVCAESSPKWTTIKDKLKVSATLPWGAKLHLLASADHAGQLSSAAPCPGLFQQKYLCILLAFHRKVPTLVRCVVSAW